VLTLVREQEMSVMPNRSVSTDIILKSTTQLNINITESLVEVYKFLFSLSLSLSLSYMYIETCYFMTFQIISLQSVYGQLRN